MSNIVIIIYSYSEVQLVTMFTLTEDDAWWKR